MFLKLEINLATGQFCRSMIIFKEYFLCFELISFFVEKEKRIFLLLATSLCLFSISFTLKIRFSGFIQTKAESIWGIPFEIPVKVMEIIGQGMQRASNSLSSVWRKYVWEGGWKYQTSCFDISHQLWWGSQDWKSNHLFQSQSLIVEL